MAGLIDYSIVKPELANALATGFQQSQERQQALAQQQRQNALADIQLRAAQRGEEEALAEREAYKGAATLGDVQQRLMQAGLGKQSLALQKQMQEQQAIRFQHAKAAHDFVQSQLNGVIANPTRQTAEAALAQAEALGANVSKERARLANIPDTEIGKWALIESGKAKEALEQSIIQLPSGGTSVEPRLAIPGAQAPMAAAPAAVFAMPAGIPGQTPPTRAGGANALALPAPGGAAAQGAMATPSGGRYYPPVMTPAQQATESREQQRIALETRRVQLAEEEARRKAAGQEAPLPPKEVQAREAKYPQAKLAVSTFESKADDLVKKLEQLKNHKGLDGILGTVYGRTSSLTRDSQAAEALYDQILARGGFQELQNMRQASPTGGALGNVSNQEGQYLRQAFGALTRVQGRESFQNAIDDVIAQIKSSKDRTRDAFEETYQYRAGKQPAAAAPAAAPAARGAKFLGFE